MNIEKFILDSLENIGQTNFDVIIKSLGVVFVIFWLIVVYWVFVDSRERTKNRFFQFFSVLLVLVLNVPGLIAYLLIRPRYTVDEIYWAELERRYLKQEVSGLSNCPGCKYETSPNYLVCPACGIELRKKCPACGSYNEMDWKYCPYCVASVGILNNQVESMIEVPTSQVTANSLDSMTLLEPNLEPNQVEIGTSLVENLTVPVETEPEKKINKNPFTQFSQRFNQYVEHVKQEAKQNKERKAAEAAMKAQEKAAQKAAEQAQKEAEEEAKKAQAVIAEENLPVNEENNQNINKSNPKSKSKSKKKKK